MTNTAWTLSFISPSLSKPIRNFKASKNTFKQSKYSRTQKILGDISEEATAIHRLVSTIFLTKTLSPQPLLFGFGIPSVAIS